MGNYKFFWDLSNVISGGNWLFFWVGKNTQNVTEWFTKIKEKSKYKFIVFNIKNFHLSIKETLLIKAINFVEKLVNITNEDKGIIKHARKSLLYDNSEPWMKKDSG